MVNKKAVIICSIIALILVAIIVVVQIKIWRTEYDKLGKVYESHTSTNQTNIENKTENQVSENTTNSTQAENTNSSNVQGAEEKIEEPDIGEYQARELVKKEWGENDTTVYYTLDSKSGDVYIISVRSKTTTAQLAEYEVNIVTGDVTIK